MVTTVHFCMVCTYKVKKTVGTFIRNLFTRSLALNLLLLHQFDLNIQGLLQLVTTSYFTMTCTYRPETRKLLYTPTF